MVDHCNFHFVIKFHTKEKKFRFHITLVGWVINRLIDSKILIYTYL